ncbi:MAG: DUF1385 domain-containing protein [Clostridia bacterium]
MKTKETYTSRGGQAVIEGVMMRGPKKTALAVRNSSGEIEIEELSIKPIKSKILKAPFIRGTVSFLSSMVIGYKSLEKSATMSGMDEDLEDSEPSKFEKFLTNKLGDNLFKIIMYISLVIGLLFSVLLFIILPTYTTKFVNFLAGGGIPSFYLTVIESVIKLTIFLIYLILVAQMKDIKRVFQYHGAEHKTIFCYEHKMPLTVENVRTNSRFHPRCGTSFLILVMLISIAIFMLPIFQWDNLLLRVLTKIAFLPIVAGFSYEVIRLAGKYENLFTKIVSAPGLWVQRLTTKEPDDGQIEVAIASLKAVLEDNEESQIV